MNTRVQVEHPITEETTGIDIVREQLRIAHGAKLNLRQQDIVTRGHAFECRINAEDPKTFRPSPGRISKWDLPGGPGVRIDTHVTAGYTIPPHYDSMIGKIIVHGETREEALARLEIALAEMRVEGVTTNLSLHQDIVADPAFREGSVDIHFLENWLRTREEP